LHIVLSCPQWPWSNQGNPELLLKVSLKEESASLSSDAIPPVREEACSGIPVMRKAATDSFCSEPASSNEKVILAFKNKVEFPKRKDTSLGLLSRLVPGLTTWGESLNEQDEGTATNGSVAVTGYTSPDGADSLVVAHDKSAVFASLEVRLSGKHVSVQLLVRSISLPPLLNDLPPCSTSLMTNPSAQSFL
jgi:hypothetical protein